ncbi:MAG: hypothetical protein RLZ05_1251 [Bacteroidota bacterium]|jgi:uncharacterized membrane protein
MKYFLSLLALLAFLTSQVALAQTPSTAMADQMRSDGRIYVVIAVLLTILAGLVLYLVRLEKKIKTLEKE